MTMREGESINIGGVDFTPAELAELIDAAGGNMFLLAEAVASTRMSRDPRMQTRHLCEAGKCHCREEPEGG